MRQERIRELESEVRKLEQAVVVIFTMGATAAATLAIQVFWRWWTNG